MVLSPLVPASRCFTYREAAAVSSRHPIEWAKNLQQARSYLEAAHVWSLVRSLSPKRKAKIFPICGSSHRFGGVFGPFKATDLAWRPGCNVKLPGGLQSALSVSKADTEDER